jgi:integrase
MAGKLAKELGALAVKNLTEEGMHFVGGVTGLALVVKASGTRSWVLRVAIGGKRSHIGLGGYPDTTLAQAHERARQAKDKIQQGIDPLAEKRRRMTEVVWTFDRCADEYIKLHRPSWKNAKHAEQWVSTLNTYASPVIGGKPVRDVCVGDVLAVIEPYWLTKNETMVRTRNRIELVLGWAASRGYRAKENPAQWRGNLQHSLPKPSKVNNRQHHAALPYKDAHGFMLKLAQVEGMSARALEWVILTACRSGEARGATWDEIDLEAGLWTIPKERMKADREHRVPLSAQALELLQSLPRFEPVEGKPEYVFTGRSGGELSDMSLTALIRRMKVDATAHGFRSTFADWAAEQTAYPVELREMALAHTLGDKTREAYQRGDMMERRRQMMADWGRYVTTPATSASVVSIRKAAA